MNLITWGHTPWEQSVPLHVAWDLLRVALGLGLGFALVHLFWARGRAGQTPGEGTDAAAAVHVPARVARHSLSARLFHWIMAAAMLTLLATAFLPKAGLLFAWVNLHWMAGTVLVLAILFHIVNAVFFMDFASIWPNARDLRDAGRGIGRAFGGMGPAPGKPGKYALLNKLYHLAILACGLAMAATGVLLLFKVRTPFFTRDPYILSEAAWGVVYLLHGFTGVALVALVIVHVYFAARPEERAVTRSMVVGSLDRDFYLAHHDPKLWPAEAPRGAKEKA
ncbi:Di-heme cytochrome, transmembrane [Desulfovibrio sp. X2]|uniref:cytochrome b/b6 domain-containing protein n=1 Tax=Desulfovibrio sp. X2 TaxID=941449 RepID=UPI000358F183|nr:cytochrome b/b6 domain-containing protein [Desulfovibrio sp. X2]EPR41612.1 Di-heme cytochrome, transmembrane [Desulfovibrio sp. X2]